MAETTGIQWTNATWSVVTGCTKVSGGCDNCYAERLTNGRLRNTPKYAAGFDEVVFHHQVLDQPRRWAKPRMIFVNSMSDTFHTAVSNEQIGDIFNAMRAAPHHTYQVLTKRPNRVRRWWQWYRGQYLRPQEIRWPANIWLGTSVETHLYLPRIRRIAGIAPVTFVSAEPLLGSLFMPGNIRFWLGDYLQGGLLQWVIVGGESGKGWRRMDAQWARDILAACRRYGVPFFMKQVAGVKPYDGLIPPDLRVREYPA